MNSSTPFRGMLPRPTRAGRVLPGIALCALIGLGAELLDRAQVAVIGRAWLEALVLAILLGTLVRAAWQPSPVWRSGITFSAKTLLEVAVVLLGASLSLAVVARAGAELLGGIALVVGVAILASYGLGRLFGLPHGLALLIACGNSICGNSAIASVAPVIGADSDAVATSIGFTAVLGVAVVLILPPLGHALGLHPQAFGVLSGLTVYAVPQVVAATAPFSALSVPIGTLVKLMRVLMLGPVILVLSLMTPATPGRAHGATAGHGGASRRWLPWFIPGFLGLMLARSGGVIPAAALAPIAAAASVLTVVAMAALGLETDLRAVGKAGLRTTTVVTLSLVVLGAITLVLLHLLALS